MAATLEGCNPELAERARRVLDEGQGRIWLSEGKRTFAEQTKFWLKAVREHPLNPRQWAALPGTSDHEKGKAWDAACRKEDERLRAELCRKWGFVRPLPNEPWHCLLDPKRKPLSVLVIQSNTDPEEADDDMPRPEDIVSRYRYPNGAEIQLQRNGGVRAYGCRFMGSMGNLADSRKQSFHEGGSIKPLDPANPGAGWTVYEKGGSEYTFAPGVMESEQKFRDEEEARKRR